MTAPTYAPPDAATWDTPAITEADVSHARHWVRGHLTELKLPADVIDAAEVIASELLTNVILHAPGAAQLTLLPDGDDLVITCADTGPYPLTETPHADGEEHGRGLQLIDALTGQRRFTRRRTVPGKRIVVLLDLNTDH